jgi:ABC-type multidrug transport system permease subunit
MIGIYLLLTYAIGVFMTKDQFETSKYLTIMDVIMFFMSPFVIPNFIVVKICSHIWDLEEIVMSKDDKND